ncbi:MAG: Uncharacterized conserved protein, DUF1501 family [Verrucomicrobia bacterium]|nr:MAG: Uncharacterized conserved protein, DUF1501 family [Verrucomicrobiota bacterium]
MYVGFAGGLGLSLPELLKTEAKAAAKFYPTREGVAKSLIHIYLPGGMAHQESFDPKPFAPAEYRGPFKAIDTKLSGVQFSENMKEMAAIADKITVIRSMTHREAAHERGTHNMFTGYTPSPALQYPSFGSVVAHELGSQNNLPPYVCVPSQPNEFAGTGYLSSAYGPFSLGSDPAASGFTVKDLSLPNGVDDSRFTRRRNLLEAVDSHFRSMEKADSIDAMDSFYHSAYGLISSQKAREAFNIEKEDGKLRDRYGRNQAGQRMIMARRLVEAGVRLVTLTYGGWDHHNNIQSAFKSQGAELDKALATLIRDLDERGMLDSTMVMVSSEFGRTPKINNTDGRDHWPRVFSTVLAGGGVKRGFVYGSSDSLAAEPDSDPMSVQDFATTVYNQLGITADKELIAPGPRPIEIVAEGKVIKELLSKMA